MNENSVNKYFTATTRIKYWLGFIILIYPLLGIPLLFLSNILYIEILQYPIAHVLMIVFFFAEIILPPNYRDISGGILFLFVLFVGYCIILITGVSYITKHYAVHSPKNANIMRGIIVVLIIAQPLLWTLNQQLSQQREHEKYEQNRLMEKAAATKAEQESRIRTLNDNPNFSLTVVDRRIEATNYPNWRVFRYSVIVEGQMNPQYVYELYNYLCNIECGEIIGKDYETNNPNYPKSYGLLIPVNYQKNHWGLYQLDYRPGSDSSIRQYNNGKVEHLPYNYVVLENSVFSDTGFIVDVRIPFEVENMYKIQSHVVCLSAYGGGGANLVVMMNTINGLEFTPTVQDRVIQKTKRVQLMCRLPGWSVY